MNNLARFREPPPPRLTMDEYADWVERLAATGDRETAMRQKALEERIDTPFRFPDEPPPPSVADPAPDQPDPA